MGIYYASFTSVLFIKTEEDKMSAKANQEKQNLAERGEAFRFS